MIFENMNLFLKDETVGSFFLSNPIPFQLQRE